MIIATAGHVDHGKTSLVQALTGIDTDRLEQEKLRGLTIDLGFAYAEMNGRRVGFIDVPGHIRFIHNMLAGVSSVDHALIVVAADDGPMPQTREHIRILDLLGVSNATVALTKTDRVDDPRVTEVARDIRQLLATTRFKTADIVPVSVVNGNGLETLTEALTAAPASNQPGPPNAFRLCADRVFHVKGAGLIVTGTVTSGEVRVGDNVMALPQQAVMRVRGLHRQDERAEIAARGDRCALNISGELSREDIHRGTWFVADAQANPKATASARCNVVMFDLNDRLRRSSWYHLHTAANHILTKVREIDSARGFYQLQLETPLHLWRGDRFILRDPSAESTISGGRVLEPNAESLRQRNHQRCVATLESLALPGADERLGALLAAQPNGVDLERFRRHENISAKQVESMVARDDIVVGDDHAIMEASVVALAQVVTDLVATSASESVSMPQVARALGVAEPVVNLAVSRAIKSGKLQRTGNSVSLPRAKPALSEADQQVLMKVAPLLAQEPLQPPVLHHLADAVNMQPKALDTVLARCAQLGYLVSATPNRYFLPTSVAVFEQLLLDTARRSEDGLFQARQFRDAAGIGRNLAIEILEYFDRTGRTVRLGDKRKVTKLE